jgi:hypothetical protein
VFNFTPRPLSPEDSTITVSHLYRPILSEVVYRKVISVGKFVLGVVERQGDVYEWSGGPFGPGSPQSIQVTVIYSTGLGSACVLVVVVLLYL